ncbi:beta-lactamase family protein [Mycoplasmatota bacterium]|nr:beta-lactamase family protein [Mycoplasmatota bacterium]
MIIIEIQQLINDYKSEYALAPGIAVAINKGGVVYKKSYGMSNIENQVKINSKTNFYIASVSKTFTASAIMLLRDKGLVNINDSIREYFPDLQDYYKDIKIINLINHTSGLRDYFKVFLDKDILNGVTNEKVYHYIKTNNMIEFHIGTKFQYSNTGYVLLAMLVEKVSGVSFSQFLSHEIFKPLNMKSTFVNSPLQPIIPNKAYAYKEIDNVNYCDDHLILTTGDGGIYSNIEDLLLWSQVFNNDKLSSGGVIEEIFSTKI